MNAALLLDIDGTLLDSNDAHAHAWIKALAEEGIQTDFKSVRERIGMGGDHLLPSLLGLNEDSATGQRLSQRRGEIFRAQYLDTLKPFPETRAWLEAVRARGVKLVGATSGNRQDAEKLLKLADVHDLLESFTTADDAESSKPDPDIVAAALKKAAVPAEHALMIGDTPYDIAAAKRAGVRAVGFTSGGWPADKLSGAVLVLDGPAHAKCELDKLLGFVI